MRKLLFLLIPACLFAQQAVLNDQRIMVLVQSGVSEAELLRLISTAPKIDFDLRPVSTDAMMKLGVSENVIKAMAARESGAPPVVPTSAKSKLQPTTSSLSSSTAPLSVVSKDWVLHEGTPVRIRLMHNISSATAQEGDTVDFQTIDEIVLNNVVVIPRGTTVLATITSAQAKRRLARGGKLALNVDSLRLATGEKLPLRGVQSLKGGGHVGAMTGAIVGTALLVWPAAPFFLFMHGKDATIPEGREATVYTGSDYQVVAARF